MKLIKEYYEYSGAFVALVAVGLTLLLVQGEEHQVEDTVAKTIFVGETVQPYNTETKRDAIIRFKNTADDPLDVVFESGIEDFTVKSGSSKMLDLSEYSDLPAKNYYSVETEGGRIVFSED
jgi:hypothetical protein